MNLPSNLWNSPLIKQRLYQEAGFECSHGKPTMQHYWFIVPESDTKVDLIELKNYESSMLNLDPHPHQMGMAKELMIMLNKNIDHDGLWIVGWTHPPAGWEAIRVDGDNCWNRMVMIWLDEDGDIQFPVETDLPIYEIVSNGLEYYTELCETAWQTWDEAYGKKAQKQDFGLKDEQVTKKTLAALN